MSTNLVQYDTTWWRSFSMTLPRLALSPSRYFLALLARAGKALSIQASDYTVKNPFSLLMTITQTPARASFFI